MKSRTRLFGALVIFGVTATVVVGVWLAGLALRSDSIVDQVGIWPTATPFSETQISGNSVAMLAAQLEAAGLTPGPYLDATGVEAHLARLSAGQIDAATLAQYAADLQTLNKTTAKYGAQVPASFWDVGNEDMAESNVTEYNLVNGLAQPALESYIGLFGRAFARFKQFKEAEPGSDTALDTELDLLLITLDYLDETLGPLPAGAPAAEREARAQEAVRIWQGLVVGTTRFNPLTDAQMVQETLSSRMNVVELWRHHTGQQLTHPEVWGLSGFAEQFVGDYEKNVNQVEHLSISTFIQVVLKEPELVLSLEEDKELLSGHSSGEAMALADKAINNAVATQFAPYFAADPRGTVEHLRCFLKDACPARK
ncbi:MAG: hypothetical protein Kow0031_14030 [Anaerolineae bacterium]